MPFIASDSMAVGALKALQEAGLQVPRDTAIVSFNGIDEAEYASTPLSTVKYTRKRWAGRVSNCFSTV